MAAPVRLQRYLAAAGVAARRKAEELITAGRVKVNGKVANVLGTKIDPDHDQVEVDGEAVVALDMFYVLLNKPKACITAVTDDRGRPTVMDYLPNLPVPVKPVGRLDFYTEGVLLLTNDGELAARLLAPANHVPKTYHVKVRGQLDADDLKAIRTGITLDDGTVTMPAEVEQLPGESKHTWLAITIHEGKHRQIHRMIEALGSQVDKLQRVAFANLTFHDLRVGDGRELNQQELNELRDLVGLDHKPVARGAWRSNREDTDIPRRARAKARAEAEAELLARGGPDGGAPGSDASDLDGRDDLHHDRDAGGDAVDYDDDFDQRDDEEVARDTFGGPFGGPSARPSARRSASARGARGPSGGDSGARASRSDHSREGPGSSGGHGGRSGRADDARDSRDSGGARGAGGAGGPRGSSGGYGGRPGRTDDARGSRGPAGGRGSSGGYGGRSGRTDDARGSRGAGRGSSGSYERPRSTRSSGGYDRPRSTRTDAGGPRGSGSYESPRSTRSDVPRGTSGPRGASGSYDRPRSTRSDVPRGTSGPRGASGSYDRPRSTRSDVPRGTSGPRGASGSYDRPRSTRADAGGPRGPRSTERPRATRTDDARGSRRPDDPRGSRGSRGAATRPSATGRPTRAWADREQGAPRERDDRRANRFDEARPSRAPARGGAGSRGKGAPSSKKRPGKPRGFGTTKPRGRGR